MATIFPANGPTNISPSALVEFQLFPSLPAELRDLIWTKALSPRLIKIDDLSGNHGPALLTVCRDSRAIARPLYNDYRATRISDGVKVGFFINPLIDIFEVCSFSDECHNSFQLVALLNIVSCRYPAWVNGARRLAVCISSDVHKMYPLGYMEQTWKQIHNQFPELEELVMVVDSKEGVALESLVRIERGKDVLGRMKERFDISLKKYQREKKLLLDMKVSLMSVGGESQQARLKTENLNLPQRAVAYSNLTRTRIIVE